VIVPSRFYLKKFGEWGWAKEQLIHIPNFVSCNSLEPDFTPGDYFLYFGRLAAAKGLKTLLQAASDAGVTLVVAGSGELEAEVREAADRSSGAITYVGRRAGEDLHALVRGARAVVLPSEWYENAPMSVLEAGALGTPAIGADIGGIPELVRDEETGWLFPSGNVAALSVLLRRVATMPDARVWAAGIAAREMVASEYSAERYVERMLDLYVDIGVRLAQPVHV
jgi:glycosyltransferase involved in cell wall biosynthesis